MSDRSDRDLVRRAKAGETGAFDVLVEKYQHRILNLVGRYVSDRTARQDVAQEAFLKAWRNIGSFRGDSQFYTWLFRITVNTAMNYLAAARRRPEHTLPPNEEGEASMDDLQVDLDTPQGEAEAEEIAAVVNEVISELSEDLRVAITLRELEGMSSEQIVYVMQCPIGTVRSRIFRARKAIEKRLRPLLDDSPGGIE